MKRISWLLLFSFKMLFSQEPLYNRAIHYDVKDGLPQNLVSGIAQDADGFIWLSTMDGLARFDGKQFLTFQHRSADTSGLSFSPINFMALNRDNTLWLFGQSNQLNKFIPSSYQVIKPNVSLSGADPHKLLVEFELIEACQRKITDSLSTQVYQQLSETEKAIGAFGEDYNGRLWVATEKGLRVFDSVWQNPRAIDFVPEYQLNFRNFPRKVDLFHLPDNRIAIIQESKIVIYDPIKGSFKSIIVPNPYINKINFGAVTKDLNGRLIFEYQNSIYRLEDDDSLTLLFQYTGSGIRSIFIDRSNTLWIGTDPEGLLTINLLRGHFKSQAYDDEFISDVLINEVGISPDKITREYFNGGNAYTMGYTFSDDKTMYLTTSEGGTVGNAIIKISDASMTRVFSHRMGGQLAFGPDKRIWFLDLAGNLFRWNDFSIPPLVTKLEFRSSVPSKLQCIAVDAGNMWAAVTPEGVHQYQHDKLSQVVNSYGNFPIQAIRNDPANDSILWIGSYGGGLFKWNKLANKLSATYNITNGLSNNTVYTIVPDSLGYLWLSSNFGISRFNPRSETFTNYAEDDGLIESEFNRHHAMLLPDGRIAMGGTKGYSVFNPYHFWEDNFSPNVLVTGLSINGKPIDHRKDSLVLSSPVSQLKNLSLSYTNNSLGLEVAANQFNVPGKINFRYKLEGSDDDWVDNKGNRSIRFNNLPYGKYTLWLNASNTSGRWSSTVRKIEIVIHPPFWLTWWAYSFYGLIGGVVVRTYWRGYKRRLKEKQEAEFNIREASRLREVDEMKNHFFSNITHEFRTPLTLILSPLEKHLNDGTLPPKALTLLNNNYRHASQLLKLVNQLLDIAKLEAGQMLVSPTVGELSMFIEQCVSAFKQQAERKKIMLSLFMYQMEGHYLFDHDKMEKIIFNLLSNAIKFTPEGGTVSLTASNLQNDRLEKPVIEIKVEDTGIGISPDKLPNIFERFYQADDSATRAHEGSGIGLALVKELVDLMDGEVFVESVVGSGTTFRVELLMEKLKEIPAAQAVTEINNFKVEDNQQVTGIDHEKPVLLVVEDNAELRAFIKESLTANWEVMEASNGLDGWTIIERELPEIVISDVMMPGMNGFELCKKAKQDPRTNHISFIMLTAKAAQESKIEGLESGADDYLTKPFHLHELELRIRNQLLEKNNLRKHLLEKVLPTQPRQATEHVNDVFLKKLQHYMDEHLMDSDLTAENIAEAMAMSQRTLNRKLHAIVGQSIVDYVRKYRLQKSLLLLATGLHVNEVAHQVGFETPRYYSQCFKDQYQQTPSDYANSMNLS